MNNGTTPDMPPRADLRSILGIDIPLICGAMYPCSNPELVAAASEAGGIGIIQPISLVYVHGDSFVEGLNKIRSLTDRPVGFNAIVEKSSRIYEQRMMRWVDEALEGGVRFFITALGNPRWVCDRVHANGGIVFHDVTERRFADKALSEGVDGLICVNNRAGGHTGQKSPQTLWDELSGFGVPMVCAGGIGSPAEFRAALEIGYAGAQLGTRFIATQECNASEEYKQAIVRSTEDDIVLTDTLSGVDCSIIKTPKVEKAGYRAGPIARWLLRGRKTKHWMRTLYSLRSLRTLKRASKGLSYKDVWLAGKSVHTIREVQTVAQIMEQFSAALPAANLTRSPATSTESTQPSAST